MYKPNVDARWHNHRCRGKAVCVTYSECVFVALVIQHASIILSSVAIFFHTIS